MHWNPNSRLELVAYYIITVVFCPCYMSVSCCKSSILPEILDSEMRLRLNLLLLLLDAIIYPAEGDMVLFSFFNWQKSFKILLVASFLNLMSIFHPTIYIIRWLVKAECSYTIVRFRCTSHQQVYRVGGISSWLFKQSLPGDVVLDQTKHIFSQILNNIVGMATD